MIGTKRLRWTTSIFAALALAAATALLALAMMPTAAFAEGKIVSKALDYDVVWGTTGGYSITCDRDPYTGSDGNTYYTWDLGIVDASGNETVSDVGAMTWGYGCKYLSHGFVFANFEANPTFFLYTVDGTCLHDAPYFGVSDDCTQVLFADVVGSTYDSAAGGYTDGILRMELYSLTERKVISTLDKSITGTQVVRLVGEWGAYGYYGAGGGGGSVVVGEAGGALALKATLDDAGTTYCCKVENGVLVESSSDLNVVVDESSPYEDRYLNGVNVDDFSDEEFAEQNGYECIVDASGNQVKIAGYELAAYYSPVLGGSSYVYHGDDDIWYARDSTTGKFGAVTSAGEVVIPFEFDGIMDMGQASDSDLVPVLKDGSWYIYEIGVASGETQTMYRLYNPNSGEHFYTASSSEKDGLVKVGWNYEGIGWTAPVSSGTPVYRMYNQNPSPKTGSGEHHYTTSWDEKTMLENAGWTYEGIGWYSDDSKSVPLYRLYNPNEFNNNHHYTTDKSERDNLLSLGWRDEGIAWYGI